MRAQGTPPSDRAARSSPAPAQDTQVVLTSSSGGIAKGSYQGGVDWTIIEFLRREYASVHGSGADPEGS